MPIRRCRHRGPRAPRAFAAADVQPVTETVESYSDPLPDPDDLSRWPPRSMGWLARLFWATAGLLLSLGLGLALDSLITGLFAANPWLGWVGLTILGLFVLALIALVIREVASLWRLRTLDHLKLQSAEVFETDNLKQANAILGELARHLCPPPRPGRAPSPGSRPTRPSSSTAANC